MQNLFSGTQSAFYTCSLAPIEKPQNIHQTDMGSYLLLSSR